MQLLHRWRFIHRHVTELTVGSTALQAQVSISILVMSAASGLAILGVPAELQAQGEVDDEIIVDDPRPVAKAAEILSAKYGYVVTYEDPEYQYEGDVREVTQEVAKSASPKNRVLVPAGGALTIRNLKGLAHIDAAARGRAMVAAVIEAQGAEPSQGGTFRIAESRGMIHIIPQKVRDANGEWVSARPVLDTIITIPQRTRSGLEMLREICEALSKKTGETVVLGAISLNAFSRIQVTNGADNVPAREVLSILLGASAAKMSWQLFYAPDLQWHVLNIRPAPGDLPNLGEPAERASDQRQQVLRKPANR